ncbi:MAG: polysaccharide pyruvyl transferase family protein [Phycisphaera sp.]|nr:polysaccharide pyruvyl transferase family protein [Phycisphaera sp.]
MNLNRRTFLQAMSAVILASRARGAESRPPRILLRSSWQMVNIGDIGHTPGVLALIEKHIPGAEVRVWSSGDNTADLAAPVEAMEHKRFPNVTIVKGRIGKDGKATSPELAAALEWTDFLLHGSGASFVAVSDVTAFVKHVGKPFGIYGITWSGGSESQLALMSSAKFIYFRDSISLGSAKKAGITCPIMEFGPDGAFGVDLRDDETAERFLKDNGLEPKKFVCCIPRLRYTPYWLIKTGRKLDPVKHARNEEMKEHDHAPLRDAITAVARRTDHKVLLCPEDMTHIAVGKEMIYDKLPDDVRKRVVWRDKYWLTDEALSVYVRSSGLFGLEMHSPIMCIGNGIPALVGRFAEQTTKGLMWRDIGLDDWLFDMDNDDDVARYTSVVLSLVQHPDAAEAKARKALEFVHQRQAETMAVVKQSCPA